GYNTAVPRVPYPPAHACRAHNTTRCCSRCAPNADLPEPGFGGIIHPYSEPFPVNDYHEAIRYGRRIAMSLDRKRVALLAEDLYEDPELWYPYYRLLEAGAQVRIVGPQAKTYTSKHGYPVMAE